jgi:predicted membrane-bound spermidine synthase
VLGASATVGFAFFLMELVWYRLLGPLLGGSVFTFGLVLAIALVGIGVGGFLYTLTSGDRPATLAGFASSCLLEALAVAGTFALGDRVAVLTMVLLPLRSVGFGAHVAGWAMVATLVVLPPAIVAGYQFPMLIALLGRGRDRIGRQIGLTYAANTLGAIVGSLAGGFGLLPWLSAPGAWRLVAVVLTLLGVTGTILASREHAHAEDVLTTAGHARRSPRVFSVLAPRLLAAAAALALLAAQGPTSVWRHGGIGAGRAPANTLSSPNELESWRQKMRSWVEWEADGVESSVALAFDPAGYAFLINGKSDGSARADAGTQVMLGLVGAFRQAEPRTALVVGLGTGSTAGWLAALPSMQRVDAVELEPLVVNVARACELTNHAAMHNSKVRVIIGDARETLLTGRDRYDIIASEPSNPFRAGIASLFTQEFYRAASDRLSEDGVFAQWVQGYEIDAPTVKTIYATMASVFPQIDTWQTHRGDLVLVGSRRPRPYSGRETGALVTGEPFRSALRYAWGGLDVNAVFAHYVASDALARSLARTPRVEINTDDRNAVEFGFARSVGRSGSNIILEIRQLARGLNAARPPLADADGIVWPAVDTALVSYNASEEVFEEISDDAPPEELARRRALHRYYQAGDIAGARALWRQQSGAPRDLIELAMVADVEAESGSDEALPFIEQLRADQPAEADVVLATLGLRQGRFADAASALESALTRLRTDPWPALRYKQKAIALTDPIAAHDPALARRMYDALRPTFAVRALDSVRLAALASLSRRLDFPALCREPFGAMEPFPPWTAFMLTLRRDCYQAAGDPRLAIATRDLDRFARREAVPLAAGVPQKE